MEEEKKYLSDLSLLGLVKLIDGDKEKGKDKRSIFARIARLTGSIIRPAQMPT